MVKFQIRSEGCRVGRSVGRSPIRFFDLILNNALALRASHNTSIPESVIEHLLKHSRHEAR